MDSQGLGDLRQGRRREDERRGRNSGAGPAGTPDALPGHETGHLVTADTEATPTGGLGQLAPAVDEWFFTHSATSSGANMASLSDRADCGRLLADQ